MQTLVVLAVVMGITTALFNLSRSRDTRRSVEDGVFRFPALIVWATFFAIVGFVGSVAYAASKSGGISFDQLIKVGSLLLIAYAIWLYFFRTTVIVTDHSVVKVTPYWRKEIEFSEVREVTVYGSEGNPIAAMTKLKGDQTITIESMLEDYDRLISLVRVRCKNAKTLDR